MEWGGLGKITENRTHWRLAQYINSCVVSQSLDLGSMTEGYITTHGVGLLRNPAGIASSQKAKMDTNG